MCTEKPNVLTVDKKLQILDVSESRSLKNNRSLKGLMQLNNIGVEVR